MPDIVLRLYLTLMTDEAHRFDYGQNGQKGKKNQKTIHYYFLRDGSELGRARGSQNGEKKEGIM
jgi:hypothetical protein